MEGRDWGGKGEGENFRDKCKEKTWSFAPSYCKLFLFLFSNLIFENGRDFVRALKEIELSGNFQGVLKCNSAQRNTIDSMFVDIQG